MDSDKSWMELSRVSLPYIKGVNGFLNFAFANKYPELVIKCPCKKCRNTISHKREVVYEHLIIHGFVKNYTRWIYHVKGAPYTMGTSGANEVHASNTRDDMCGLLHDIFGNRSEEGMRCNDPYEDQDGMDENASAFFKLLKDGERELYPGCKSFSSLSFIVRLFHMKTLYKWSHTSFIALLQFLKEALPEGVKLPGSYSQVRKIVNDLGFDYQKIHACPNDCMLYWKENKDREDCIVCHTSRWKQFSGESDDEEARGRKIPAKVVRYFPLKPRLQRLFMSLKTSSLMRWHAEERDDDDILRHPADSKAWKTFDQQNPNFSSDSRNIRLGLAADGFNPFKTMSISHSTWPVVLMIYNLPPWMCMKQPYLILSTLIDGPRGPGNNIDVYLQPLIDELKELWNDGILTYDASTEKVFCMREALMWTISDFPAYANLSGWSTKGRLACPCCNKNTHLQWLKNGKKFCYMGHRRGLDHKHKFRNDTVAFDGKVEREVKPTQVSGDDILEQLEVMERNNEKGHSSVMKKRKTSIDGEGNGDSSLNWKKKSIFFQLPYWKDHLIRHNLDVMHVEKNVCDNILWTLLNVDGKSKDNIKARRDLENMGIRKALHPKSLSDSKVYLPPACFTMSKSDKDIFCKVLKNIKVPDGYASNISRRVNIKGRNISGLKSHDNHIIMQQLLPLAVRKSLPTNVARSLIELCNFYRQLCSKTMTFKDYEYLQDRVALTLCHLEKIFPPAFFDVMEHLTIHLAEEAMIAGPVQFRWMYPIERYVSCMHYVCVT